MYFSRVSSLDSARSTAFFSRLLPVVRTFISLPAGIARMNFGKFILYTFLGAFVWSSALALGGYEAGANWENFRNKMRPFDYPIIAIIIILLVIFIVRGRQSRSRVPAEVRE